MEEQLRQIAERMKELREILDIPASQIADAIGKSEEAYLQYENGLNDMPISVLYTIAAAMNVDPTVLLTGETPKMDSYTVVRQGRGVTVERYKGYGFSALAFNYIGRSMEPMIVTIEPADKAPDLVVHGGQEVQLCVGGEDWCTHRWQRT